MWILYIFALWLSPLLIEHPYLVCSKIASKHWFEGHHYSISISLSLSCSPGGPSARVPFNTHVWIAMRNRTAPREFAMHARDSFKRVTNGMHLPDEIAVPNSGREFLRVDGVDHSRASQGRSLWFWQKNGAKVKIVASNLISKINTINYLYFFVWWNFIKFWSNFVYDFHLEDIEALLIKQKKIM